MSKTFVLRTHALLSSKASTQKFGEDNEIVIPMAVIDELQDVNQEYSEKLNIANDVLKYVNSFDSELLSKEGVKQENGSILRVITTDFNEVEVNLERLSFAEKRTLQICLGLKENEGKEVILVTNNLSLQLKAKSVGIRAESFKDETFPRLSEQYKGRAEVYTRDDVIDSFYANKTIDIKDIFDNKDIEFVENEFFVIKSENKSALGMYKEGKIIKLLHQKESPYGIKPKNVGQKFLLEALLSDCSLVVIKGNAGTGKTYCTMGVGLQKTEEGEYSRILVTRSVTASEQYGFLPGDIEEKLSPYLAGIKDNLSILINGSGKKKEKDSQHEDGTYFFEKGMVQIQAIGFLRGRSIVDTYFVIDETQNIDPDIIRSIVTRAGEGSKFIFLGDPTQIDNPRLTERYNGLVYLSEKMKGNPVCMQVSLNDDESVRSELARQAAQIL